MQRFEQAFAARQWPRAGELQRDLVSCKASELEAVVANEAAKRSGSPLVISVSDVDTVMVCVNFLDLDEVDRLRAVFKLHSKHKQFSIYE